MKHIWLVGFLFLTALAVGKNLNDPNPANHWPPAIVMVWALWPLWLPLAVAGLAWDWIQRRKDRQ